MDALVIDIKADGGVKALHMDKFDLGFLGSKKVQRQTDIIFDAGTQKWDIHYIQEDLNVFTSPIIGGFDGYEEARGFEVCWVNHCRLNKILPESLEGIRFAHYIRTKDAPELLKYRLMVE